MGEGSLSARGLNGSCGLLHDPAGVTLEPGPEFRSQGCAERGSWWKQSASSVARLARVQTNMGSLGGL